MQSLIQMHGSIVNEMRTNFEANPKRWLVDFEKCMLSEGPLPCDITIFWHFLKHSEWKSEHIQKVAAKEWELEKLKKQYPQLVMTKKTITSLFKLQTTTEYLFYNDSQLVGTILMTEGRMTASHIIESTCIPLIVELIGDEIQNCEIESQVDSGIIHCLMNLGQLQPIRWRVTPRDQEFIQIDI